MENNILRFEHPEYLYWLLIIPVLIAIYITIRIINKKQFQKFADSKFADLLTPLVSKSRSNTKFATLGDNPHNWVYVANGGTFIFDGGNAFDSFEDETMIDSEMSDYSENPVQNKVIKGYIDTFISNTMTNVNDEFEAVRLETNESIENTATEIKSLIYPVGSVYIADSVNINPATIFGGEWYNQK